MYIVLVTDDIKDTSVFATAATEGIDDIIYIYIYMVLYYLPRVILLVYIYIVYYYIDQAELMNPLENRKYNKQMARIVVVARLQSKILVPKIEFYISL